MQQASEDTLATAPAWGTPPPTVPPPREREVASLVAEGLSNAEIGERLAITPGTVANHVAHIARRLGLKNRVQVAVWAVERGLHTAQTPART